MEGTLDKTITDAYLAWDNTLTDRKQKFVVALDSEIITELIKRSMLQRSVLNLF